ncbi:hypothetical protein [Nocardioides sambongensis]|uniref:hypothetical protein n=1 Tax=Nocardioides sambongensis TaxID=2589074 RepID=UPI00112BF494|nr:hypothetical protein [Nocardioides sambongensis]
MSKKRKAWVHVGLPGSADVVEGALAHHREALLELGFASVAHTTSESFGAAVEILRAHKEWGLARADVEGEWTRQVRRADKERADLVFSQHLLAAASPDQADLLVDALAGYQVHVVITAGPAGDVDVDADGVDGIRRRWSSAVRKPERVHVLEVGTDPAATWKAFGKLLGFGTASLGLAGVPATVPPCTSLAEAQREIEKLARRNAALEVRLEELDRKRRKLKKKLAKRKKDATAEGTLGDAA